MDGDATSKRAADDEPLRSTIVLVGSPLLWRDCFMQCLECEGYAVMPFDKLETWLSVRRRYPAAAVLVLCEPELSSLAMLPRVAEGIATIVVAGESCGLNAPLLLHQGVRGILSVMDIPFSIALNAIRLVEAGGTFVPPQLMARKETKSDFGRLLTQRQMEVVEGIRQGKANKEIAHALQLQESTVKVHIRQIMRKLDAKNRTEIAVLANELLEISRGLAGSG